MTARLLVRTSARWLLAVLLPLAVVAAACGSSSATPTDSPAATAPPAPTATPTPDLGPPSPDLSRMVDYDHALSVDIGPRPAGSDGEQRAIAYLKRQLESFGYDVTLQSFPFSSAVYRETSFALAPSGQAVPDIAVAGSAAGDVRGQLIDSGAGGEAEVAAAGLQGAIAVVRAGSVSFSLIASRVKAAGGVGMVLVNNQPGRLNAALDPPVDIPAIGIGREDGDALLSRMMTERVTARLEIGSNDGTGTNVIARRPGRGCVTVTGGHFDSVPQSPGANDNASGTSVVLELARVAAVSHLPGDNCFTLFSGEEYGLFGSRAYLDGLPAADRARLRLMLNFDMSAIGDQWLLVGSPDAVALAQEAAQTAGVPAVPGELQGRSSDFASFMAQGIPAVLVFDSDDPAIHTPEDNFAHLETGDMADAAHIGLALLQHLAAPPLDVTPTAAP